MKGLEIVPLKTAGFTYEAIKNSIFYSINIQAQIGP